MGAQGRVLKLCQFHLIEDGDGGDGERKEDAGNVRRASVQKAWG